MARNSVGLWCRLFKRTPAWRHILLNGHYTFQSGGKMIDLNTLLAGLDLK